MEVNIRKGTQRNPPGLGPNEEFADFELLELYVASNVAVTKFNGSYVRDAYRTGLEFQDKEGFNPYRFGLVGASDSHTGIVATVENNFSGPSGARTGSAELRLVTQPAATKYRRFSASGTAGVWAEKNTRESIFSAFRRKETWATTGPRIQVRFFGGFDMAGVTPG